ncbi:sucrose-6-phosphate hydrolase [Alkalihalophilus marmarensis]|uniref:glycoside hydrolase family 32 protein n=1 Tax=Alkalihalophilus marmarensis TaxID=521377 RepID=UPI002E20E9E0|nr:sucrose-6-phosphate hydrolase [Alkalihalophilus marmarensis]MED1601561.1 sucrose-6-phosphate hydrolase [Alkalihalophilus marmarensis]
MSDRDKQLREAAYQEVETHKSLVESDRFRLGYHLMPPVGLLNDPNGFIQYKGVYHLFYQWNPFKTEHGAKFWGHYTSRDLVNWEHHEIALAPSDWFDKNGCYSGSAIEHNGKMYLFYTGNVKDEDNNRESYQVLVESEDGFTFDKKGVVVELPEGYTAHFRDPKVWKRDDYFYMVVGAQSEDLTGKAALLRSSDLYKWEHLGAIAGAHVGSLKDFGYMWECPDLFELDGEEVLILSPQGLEPEGMLYQNIYQAGYFIGKMDYENVRFDHGEFVEMDRGFEFYAPQTTEDDQGRRLLFGWLGLPEEREEDHPTIEYKWIHAMTLPRELRVKDGKLYQLPVEELKKLRHGEVIYQNVVLNEEEQAFAGVDGERLEYELTFNESPAGEVTIQMRNHATITYSPEKERLTLSRISFVDDKTIEERHCEISELKNLRVFLDSSSIEMFVNGGAEVFTARIYPDENEKNITFKTGQPTSVQLQAWMLY